ncbi:MAG: YebC/PmpR family DNA-binding transcriptional regulator [Chitinophagaceae bacterium]|nr:YebC/PmpR family DNA-binding transcriptional regulator [Chitinophagaceae bacterium]
MGRAFEYRKARKLKRWGMMAKTFTRIGKDIAIAVKNGGVDPHTNARLRAAIQNAKTANMPKENIERAIKKASSKDEKEYKEIVYEGYGPHKVAIIIETATDNPTRTVANIRNYLTKCGGSLGTTGSLDFLFERRCIFKIHKDESIHVEDLELAGIDSGVEEVELEENNTIILGGKFESYNLIQKFIEEQHYQIISSEFERIPLTTKQISQEQEEDLQKLFSKLEEDEDVQNYFHNSN